MAPTATVHTHLLLFNAALWFRDKRARHTYAPGWTDITPVGHKPITVNANALAEQFPQTELARLSSNSKH